MPMNTNLRRINSIDDQFYMISYTNLSSHIVVTSALSLLKLGLMV